MKEGPQDIPWECPLGIQLVSSPSSECLDPGISMAAFGSMDGFVPGLHAAGGGGQVGIRGVCTARHSAGAPPRCASREKRQDLDSLCSAPHSSWPMERLRASWWRREGKKEVGSREEVQPAPPTTSSLHIPVPFADLLNREPIPT